jgi:hypothetical protein
MEINLDQISEIIKQLDNESSIKLPVYQNGLVTLIDGNSIVIMNGDEFDNFFNNYYNKTK